MGESRNSIDGAAILALLGSGSSPALTPELVDLAGRHGLTALVQEKLVRQGVNHAALTEIVEDLELNAQVQLKAAQELSAAFHAAEVKAVFAKGLALALCVYVRPGLRPFVDIDVLIGPEQLKAADAVLTKLGYALDPGSLNNPIECSYKREKLPGFPVHIDLHWLYTGGDGLQAPVTISIPEIIGRTQVVNGVRVPALGDTVMLAAGNMPRKAAQPLMLVVDFERLSRQPLDWPALGAEAARLHVRVGLWLGLELARMHLNAPVDLEFLKSIEPEPARRDWLLESLHGELLWDSEKHRQRKYSFWFKLKCLDSTADERVALSALPKGVLRKLRLTRTHSQRVLKKQHDE